MSYPPSSPPCRHEPDWNTLIALRDCVSSWQSSPANYHDALYLGAGPGSNINNNRNSVGYGASLPMTSQLSSGAGYRVMPHAEVEKPQPDLLMRSSGSASAMSFSSATLSESEKPVARTASQPTSSHQDARQAPPPPPQQQEQVQLPPPRTWADERGDLYTSEGTSSRSNATATTYSSRRHSANDDAAADAAQACDRHAHRRLRPADENESGEAGRASYRVVDTREAPIKLGFQSGLTEASASSAAPRATSKTGAVPTTKLTTDADVARARPGRANALAEPITSHDHSVEEDGMDGVEEVWEALDDDDEHSNNSNTSHGDAAERWSESSSRATTTNQRTATQDKTDHGIRDPLHSNAPVRRPASMRRETSEDSIASTARTQVTGTTTASTCSRGSHRDLTRHPQPNTEAVSETSRAAVADMDARIPEVPQEAPIGSHNDTDSCRSSSRAASEMARQYPRRANRPLPSPALHEHWSEPAVSSRVSSRSLSGVKLLRQSQESCERRSQATRSISTKTVMAPEGVSDQAAAATSAAAVAPDGLVDDRAPAIRGKQPERMAPHDRAPKSKAFTNCDSAAETIDPAVTHIGEKAQHRPITMSRRSDRRGASGSSWSSSSLGSAALPTSQHPAHSKPVRPSPSPFSAATTLSSRSASSQRPPAEETKQATALAALWDAVRALQAQQQQPQQQVPPQQEQGEYEPPRLHKASTPVVRTEPDTQNGDSHGDASAPETHLLWATVVSTPDAVDEVGVADDETMHTPRYRTYLTPRGTHTVREPIATGDSGVLTTTAAAAAAGQTPRPRHFEYPCYISPPFTSQNAVGAVPTSEEEEEEEMYEQVIEADEDPQDTRQITGGSSERAVMPGDGDDDAAVTVSVPHSLHDVSSQGAAPDPRTRLTIVNEEEDDEEPALSEDHYPACESSTSVREAPSEALATDTLPAPSPPAEAAGAEDASVSPPTPALPLEQPAPAQRGPSMSPSDSYAAPRRRRPDTAAREAETTGSTPPPPQLHPSGASSRSAPSTPRPTEDGLNAHVADSHAVTDVPSQQQQQQRSPTPSHAPATMTTATMTATNTVGPTGLSAPISNETWLDPSRAHTPITASCGSSVAWCSSATSHAPADAPSQKPPKSAIVSHSCRPQQLPPPSPPHTPVSVHSARDAMRGNQAFPHHSTTTSSSSMPSSAHTSLNAQASSQQQKPRLETGSSPSAASSASWQALHSQAGDSPAKKPRHDQDATRPDAMTNSESGSTIVAPSVAVPEPPPPSSAQLRSAPVAGLVSHAPRRPSTHSLAADGGDTATTRTSAHLDTAPPVLVHESGHARRDAGEETESESESESGNEHASSAVVVEVEAAAEGDCYGYRLSTGTAVYPEESQDHHHSGTTPPPAGPHGRGVSVSSSSVARSSRGASECDRVSSISSVPHASHSPHPAEAAAEGSISTDTEMTPLERHVPDAAPFTAQAAEEQADADAEEERTDQNDEASSLPQSERASLAPTCVSSVPERPRSAAPMAERHPREPSEASTCSNPAGVAPSPVKPSRLRTSSPTTKSAAGQSSSRSSTAPSTAASATAADDEEDENVVRRPSWGRYVVPPTAQPTPTAAITADLVGQPMLRRYVQYLQQPASASSGTETGEPQEAMRRTTAHVPPPSLTGRPPALPRAATTPPPSSRTSDSGDTANSVDIFVNGIHHYYRAMSDRTVTTLFDDDNSDSGYCGGGAYGDVEL